MLKTLNIELIDDNDFAALLFALLKEKSRFEKYNNQHPTLIRINNFLRLIEKLDKELYDEGLFFFEQSQKPIK